MRARLGMEPVPVRLYDMSGEPIVAIGLTASGRTAFGELVVSNGVSNRPGIADG